MVILSCPIFLVILCFCLVFVNDFFGSENVIYHLASVEHMKSLKSFLSKNGGGTDCTDAFRLTEFDVLKVESNQWITLINVLM